MEFSITEKYTLEWTEVDKRIRLALEEDVATGDITTEAILGDSYLIDGVFVAKEEGVVAGIELAGHILGLLSEKVVFRPNVADGSRVHKGEHVAGVHGPAGTVLTAERTVLNFMQRMSGIATQTRCFVNEISHTPAKILDTRKTIPGLRELDKWAVRLGGGTNHRMRLDDLFLIKDNHITTAGSIEAAVQACVAWRQKKNLTAGIEVEVRNLDELQQALHQSGVDFILLDNMSPDEMREAVKITDGRVKLEASGNVSLQTVKTIAETGVDYISAGTLTHSVNALDISLLFTLSGK